MASALRRPAATHAPGTVLGYRADGRPIFPIAGGADDDTTADDTTAADDTDADGGEQDQDDADKDTGKDEDKLGDAGKRALDRQKAKLNAEREKRLALEQELEAERAKTATKDGEPTPEQIRAEAERTATAKANGRIVRSEVRAAAAGRLHKPADALVFLDLTKFSVDDDGQVDEDEVTEAIDDLLKERPYLAAEKTPKRPKPDRGQGGRPDGTAASLDEQIRDAKKRGDARAVIRLENQKLAKKASTTKT